MTTPTISRSSGEAGPRRGSFSKQGQARMSRAARYCGGPWVARGLAGNSIAGPLMSLPWPPAQHRWLRDVAGTASRSQRCRCRAAGCSISGPPMLYPAYVAGQSRPAAFGGQSRRRTKATTLASRIIKSYSEIAVHRRGQRPPPWPRSDQHCSTGADRVDVCLARLKRLGASTWLS
jgi:hypothetical protein